MASLSIEQVDQKIREHEQQIEELRSVRAVILKYSENGASKHSVAPTKKAVQRSTRMAPNATGLKAAILGLNLPPSFTVNDAIEELRSKRFNFDGRDPKGAVRDCLYVLAKKERSGIKLVRQGTGGQQSLYQKAST
jgi:hypothetical protein